MQPPARKFCCAVCGEDPLVLPGQSWLTGRTFCLVSKRRWALRKWFPEPRPRPKAGRPGQHFHPTPSPSGIQGSGPRGRKGLSHPRLHLSVSTEGPVRKATPPALYQRRQWCSEQRLAPGPPAGPWAHAGPESWFAFLSSPRSALPQGSCTCVCHSSPCSRRNPPPLSSAVPHQAGAGSPILPSRYFFCRLLLRRPH